MLNILLVGGTCGEESGQESGYIRKLAQYLEETERVIMFNGKTIDELTDLLDGLYGYEKYDAVLWFPLIGNKYEKMVSKAKEFAGTGVFVTSKYNTILDNAPKYTNLDIIGKALFSKSNLLLELSKFDIMVKTTIWDPLGNVYCLNEMNINVVAQKLLERIKELHTLTRVPSIKIAEKETELCESSEHRCFLDLAKGYADVFHELVHAANPLRFLGNLSLRFRCERGFPAMKIGNDIYVSRRNVDKRGIILEDMVRAQWDEEDQVVEYYGDDKPSVDAPSQLLLYKELPGVNYMLHGHCYIDNAPFTSTKLPCGVLEESNDIYLLYKKGNKYINLKGHGSIVLGDCWQDFIDIPYIARPMPEL